MTLPLSAHPALQRHPFTIGENQVSDISKLSEYYLGKLVLLGDKIAKLDIKTKQTLFDRVIEECGLEETSILTVKLENIVGSNTPNEGQYLVNVIYYEFQPINDDSIVKLGPEDRGIETIEKYPPKKKTFKLPYNLPILEKIGNGVNTTMNQ